MYSVHEITHSDLCCPLVFKSESLQRRTRGTLSDLLMNFAESYLFPPLSILCTKTHCLHRCGFWLQMHHVRFSQQNRICTYKRSNGGKKCMILFLILLFFICNESFFHPFRREVTRKALFTEKPQHQSLPSLSAPRKKPNFSCCN